MAIAKTLGNLLLSLGSHLHDHLRSGRPLVFMHEAVKLTVMSARNPQAFELTDFDPQPDPQIPIPGYLVLVADSELQQLEQEPEQEISADVLDQQGRPVGQIGIDGAIWRTLTTELDGLGLAISPTLITDLHQGDVFAGWSKNDKEQWRLYRALRDPQYGGLLPVERLDPQLTAADRLTDREQGLYFDLGPDLVVLRLVNVEHIAQYIATP